MTKRVYLYPVWIRIWHITNALLCLILILTGVSMQYSQPGSGLIDFQLAVSIHNFCGILLTISYLIYFLGNLFTANGRYYRLGPIGIVKRMLKQAKYYAFGVFKNEKPPFPIGKENKFNPLQKVSYLVVMYLFVPIVIITGWGMLFPESIIENYLGINGFVATDLLHLLSAFVISIFLIIHIYFSTMGSTTYEHFKSMITGYHEEHD
ncbi:cytochrome b/b6 domain-containing protein [Bacteroidota bacterium]